ncbi:hypothetical protein CRYUN_Cryun13aG0110500 [Craigia yunnanensis]
MTKHCFRESITSFFGHHVDPEKDEQLKGSKIEIDDKVTKVLKLIKDEEVEENSDSYYSSKDGGSRNRQLESESHKIVEGIKQELETTNLEIADLKRKLTAISEEKDPLNSDYLASLSKVQETEEIIRNLKLESERSMSEKSKLVVENEELRHKLDTATKIEAEVNQRLEDLNRENNNLILEKETVVKRIEDGEKFTEDLRREVDWMKEENITLKQELEKNKSLNSKLSEVSNEIQQAQGIIQQLMAEMSQSKEELGEKERELLTLTELHEVAWNQSSAQIKELDAQVTSLELKLESLRATNRDMEVQIENKASEAKQLEEQNIGLQSQISELDEMIVENLTVQINNLLVDMESLRTQKAQLEEHIGFKSDEATTQVKSLMDQKNTFQQELESLHGQKAELEMQLDRKIRAISLSRVENLTVQINNLLVDMGVAMHPESSVGRTYNI